MPPWLIWLLSWLLPKSIAGYRTDVLLRNHKKIEAVIDVLKEAGMSEEEARGKAIAAVDKSPDRPADQIAQEAWENRGSQSGH